MKSWNRVFTSILVLILLWALQPAVPAQDSGSVSGTSVIEGKILAADGKAAVSGATVLAYHLSTEKVYRSQSTGSNGQFQLGSLPYGYYDLAVETKGGQYVGNQVVNVPPAGKVSVVFSLTPFADQASRQSARPFPGSEATSQGLAKLEQKSSGGSFWKSPKGVAVLAGTGGVVLLALASGGGGGSASPFQP